jgi:chemotaxis protein methyltransferase CheR
MNDQLFYQLLNHFELSPKGYRKVRKGVKKRISRHMQRLGCRNINAYLAILAENTNDRLECKRLLTVSISRFFRDKQLWHFMEKSMLPELAEVKEEIIHIWSAGCACGEEVYSIKILWEHLKNKGLDLPQLQITATDFNPVCLEKARAGVYPASSIKEVSNSFLSLYFNRFNGKKHFAVQNLLKQNIIWKQSDIFSDIPGTGYRVIFLRNNLLTYYREDLQKTRLPNIIKSLKMDGFLIIGTHESLPVGVPDLIPVGSQPHVFRKVTNVSNAH